MMTIASTVFSHNTGHTKPPESNLRLLESSMVDLLTRRNIPMGEKLCNKANPPKCKVALYATTPTDVTQPKIFRTYSHRGASLNPTIVEALCATMASPPYFPAVKIGPPLRAESFLAGPVGANNPTRELLKEASAVFGNDTRVAQVLSLGSGRYSLPSLDTAEPTKVARHVTTSLLTDCEAVATELSTRLFAVDIYARLNVDSDMESPDPDNWTITSALERATATYLETSSISRIMEQSVQHVKQRVGSITIGQINHLSTAKVTAKSAPLVSPWFVLRKTAWEAMVHYLLDSSSSGQRIFAITGMAGCGKTQMVSYFLQEKGNQYTHVVFVDASSAFSLKADLQAWAQSLGNGHEGDVWEDAIRLLQSGVSEGKWLLILDNADDPRLDILSFLPKCYEGTVIMTSRNRSAGDLASLHHLELGEMEPDEAFTVLLRAAQRHLPLEPDELNSAQEIVSIVGHLAVALAQAGAYCYQLSLTTTGEGSSPFTFSQYVTRFSNQRLELMKTAVSSSLDKYQLGAYTAFDLSYGALERKTKEFLRFISFFHHSNIPLVMFSIAVGCEFADPFSLLQRHVDMNHLRVILDLTFILGFKEGWSEVQVHDTIRVLRSFSLISASSTSSMVFIHIHPLVQAWMRDVASINIQHCQTMALQTLCCCVTSNTNHLYQYLAPHINQLLDIITKDSCHVNDKHAAGMVLKERGYYEKAEGLFKQVLKVLRNHEGEVDVSASLRVMGLLASTYSAHGKWKAAEELNIKLFDLRNRIMGTRHQDTILALAELAVTYSSQGRYNEAEKLELEVLKQRKALLGENHPETLKAAANLADTYQDLGRYNESETLALYVLKRRRLILGGEAPETIQSACNLAAIYQAQSRYSEAEELGLEVLDQRRRVLGKDHPHIAHSMGNLAGTYSSLGRYKEAEDLEKESLERLRKVLGLEHPDSIQAAGNLAMTYEAQGRFKEAEALQLNVFEQRSRLLGENHPSTIDAAGNLAAIYNGQGRHSEAEAMTLRVLEQRQELLGPKHPDTILVAANLAAIYGSQGKHIQAEELQVEVLEKRSRELGKSHSSTINAASSLVATYNSQGRVDEAESLGLASLKEKEELFGKESPERLHAVAHLVAVYSSRGRYKEAEELQCEALEVQRRIFGEDHPNTITMVSSLSSIYAFQGRLTEAEELQTRALERQISESGEEHHNTIIYMSNLAIIYVKQQQWQQAGALRFRLVNLKLRSLGKEHPETREQFQALLRILRSLGMEDAAQNIQELFL